MLQLENVIVMEPSGEVEAGLNAFLDERIYQFNMQATGLCDAKPFVGVIKEDSVTIAAAINGHTWGGCCYVAHLWVHESKRRHGLVRALLRATEAEAVRRGCTQVVLSTHSFQAPAFYEQLGYVKQATVPNYPHGHAQYIYLKSLKSPA